jgi:VWFA-related protein
LLTTFLISLLTWQDFSTTVKLARIEVRAIDQLGKPLQGLTLEDLEVTENESKLRTRSLVRDELPLDLFLIVDVSGSMHANVARISQTAKQALKALKPNDRVALMSFNLKNKIRLELSSDLELVEEKIMELAQKKNFGGGTVINTPIYDAARILRKDSPKERRRAILILTDGLGTKGTRSARLLNELWEGDITLNALILDPTKLARGIGIYRRVTSPYSIAIDASVSDLANKSSGELMKINESEAPLVEIIERIRSRYTLYYDPLEGETKERKVVATLSASAKQRYPGAKAIGRRQYSAP